MTDTESSQIEQVLFLLDKFYVSDELYHEFAIAYDDMPRSYLIKQRRSDLNKMCHIERVPGTYPGAQCSFKELLQQHVKNYLEANPEHNPKEAIKVKISMDGARMSRTTNFLITSFALLQDKEGPMSSKGNRTIAVVNGREEYDTIKDSLSNVLNEINNLVDSKFIEVDGVTCPIEIFLGGDYKILLVIMGLSCATSDYACLWCKVHKSKRFDMSKPQDYYNTSPNTRTLEELHKFCSLSKSQSKYSCIREPLIHINLNNIILDELHLMSRVTDRLMENLIKEVVEKDSKEDINKKKGEEKKIYQQKLVKEINDVGITFNLWEKTNADGKGSGILDWTSLLGSDKKKMLNCLPARLQVTDLLFPETKETVIKIWRDFYDLYQEITDFNINNETPSLIYEHGRQWIKLFCSLGGKRQGYEKARVTPYMHCIPYHIPKFIHDHGPLKMFTGQGVEKNNDDAKKLYYQKSNKWDATRDVLLLESRQYALKDKERKKRKYCKKKAEYWENEINIKRKKGT